MCWNYFSPFVYSSFELLDLKVDVGMIIQNSIDKCLQGGTSGGLPHPSLITGLCRRAGVEWAYNELLFYPMAPIDHASIERYRVWDGGVSHPRGEGFILPHDSPVAEPPEQPSPVIMAAIQKLNRKVDRVSRRQTRKVDALAQRVDAMLQFNREFTTALSQVFSAGGSSSTAAPVQFPIPPVVPEYPPDSTDSTNSPPDEESDDNE